MPDIGSEDLNCLLPVSTTPTFSSDVVVIGSGLTFRGRVDQRGGPEGETQDKRGFLNIRVGCSQETLPGGVARGSYTQQHRGRGGVRHSSGKIWGRRKNIGIIL